jgi:hypothetical protein
MSLSQRLAEYIRAAFTGIWIQSHEHDDAMMEIAQLCQEHGWILASWDVDRGLQVAGAASDSASDPVAAIRSINSLAQADGSALLVLPNFHRYLQSIEILQALAHQITRGKQNRTFIVILSPVLQLPVELEKLFVVLEHELPDRQQLQSIAAGVATEDLEMPQGDELAKVLDAAAGLTRFEAEGAYSLSLVRHGRLAAESLWELKTAALRKSGLLALHRGGERFDDLGGLDALKHFCLRAMSCRSTKAQARGILLLGVPGTGKSAFAKALGSEIGRPTLLMDVGALLGSLVGQSEQNIRQALRLADAMSPAVLFVDEIEKALSGVASSGSTDSGVSARLFGSLLTWLSDHQSQVFFIGTCNDISKLPPEFARAERFDGVFFLDLPSSAQKAWIWQIYLKHYDLPADQRLPEDRDWTGAEIRSCCRLAALLDLPLIKAAQNVVPVAVTAAEQVSRLRDWAAGRCLDAQHGGIYRQEQSSSTSRRRVSRPASN